MVLDDEQQKKKNVSGNYYTPGVLTPQSSQSNITPSTGSRTSILPPVSESKMKGSGTNNQGTDVSTSEMKASRRSGSKSSSNNFTPEVLTPQSSQSNITPSAINSSGQKGTIEKIPLPSLEQKPQQSFTNDFVRQQVEENLYRKGTASYGVRQLAPNQAPVTSAQEQDMLLRQRYQEQYGTTNLVLGGLGDANKTVSENLIQKPVTKSVEFLSGGKYTVDYSRVRTYNQAVQDFGLPDNRVAEFGYNFVIGGSKQFVEKPVTTGLLIGGGYVVGGLAPTIIGGESLIALGKAGLSAYALSLGTSIISFQAQGVSATISGGQQPSVSEFEQNLGRDFQKAWSFSTGFSSGYKESPFQTENILKVPEGAKIQGKTEVRYFTENLKSSNKLNVDIDGKGITGGTSPRYSDYSIKYPQSTRTTFKISSPNYRETVVFPSEELGTGFSYATKTVGWRTYNIWRILEPTKTVNLIEFKGLSGTPKSLGVINTPVSPLTFLETKLEPQITEYTGYDKVLKTKESFTSIEARSSEINLEGIRQESTFNIAKLKEPTTIMKGQFEYNPVTRTVRPNIKYIEITDTGLRFSNEPSIQTDIFNIKGSEFTLVKEATFKSSSGFFLKEEYSGQYLKSIPKTSNILLNNKGMLNNIAIVNPPSSISKTVSISEPSFTNLNKVGSTFNLPSSQLKPNTGFVFLAVPKVGQMQSQQLNQTLKNRTQLNFNQKLDLTTQQTEETIVKQQDIVIQPEKTDIITVIRTGTRTKTVFAESPALPEIVPDINIGTPKVNTPTFLPPPVVPPFWKSMDMGSVSKSRPTFRPVTKQKTGYRPTFTAVALNIRGKPSKIESVSGLGVRPIPIKLKKTKKKKKVKNKWNTSL